MGEDFFFKNYHFATGFRGRVDFSISFFFFSSSSSSSSSSAANFFFF